MLINLQIMSILNGGKNAITRHDDLSADNDILINNQ